MRYIFGTFFLAVVIIFTPHLAWAQGGDEEPFMLEEITIDLPDADPAPSAATAKEGEKDGGFVQCSGPNCDFCDIVDMAQAILKFLLQIAIIISVIILAIAGAKLVVSRGNPGALGEAKQQLLNIVIGVSIVLLAFTIVDTFLKVLIGGDFGVWNEIDSSKCGGEKEVGTPKEGIGVGVHEVDALYDMKSDPDVGYTAGPDDGLRGGPPPTGELKEYAGYKFDESIHSNVEYMAREFGLRVTSGYRSKEKNAAVNGSRTSYHLLGRAADFVGTAEQMRKAEAWAKSKGAKEAKVHNAGTGTHLHVAW